MLPARTVPTVRRHADEEHRNTARPPSLGTPTEPVQLMTAHHATVLQLKTTAAADADGDITVGDVDDGR